MLPNLHWATITLGPIVIQVWGLFVALGIIVAVLVVKQFAKQRQLNDTAVVDASFWIMVAAMLMGRVWFVFDEWSLFSGHVLDALKIWEGGMSISGGFFGALVAGVIYFKYKKLPFLPYAEVMVYALPLGIAIGRLGCFFIFDHPGTVTNFFLGEVYFVDGLVRHNHGLYLVIDGAVLFSLFTYLRYKTKALPPYFVTIFLLWEGLVRIILDNWRIADNHWYGFTAAQWWGVVMVLGGLTVFGTRQIIRKKYTHVL
ncbi:MAG: prolipoprotein diacylglyceryl transferase family protein [Patescibacteria group bacterium]|jgi:prolipoprotein diacylglyceryl transferase